MQLRTWLERSAILVAVVATMATSRPRWHIDAEVPPNDPATARLLVVEASDDPRKNARFDEHWIRVDPSEQWTGKAKYVIPAGTALTQVMVSGTCSGGCFRKCVPPDDAFVHVVSLQRAHTWKLERTTPAMTTRVTRTSSLHMKFPVTASHPVRFETRGARAHPYHADGYVHVDFYTSEREVTDAWTLHATMEGLCADNAPCDPPPDAVLEIGPNQEDPVLAK